MATPCFFGHRAVAVWLNEAVRKFQIRSTGVVKVDITNANILLCSVGSKFEMHVWLSLVSWTSKRPWLMLETVLLEVGNSGWRWQLRLRPWGLEWGELCDGLLPIATLICQGAKISDLITAYFLTIADVV